MKRTHASTTSHPPSRLCSNTSWPFGNGVHRDDFSWIHRKPKLSGLAQHTVWKDISSHLSLRMRNDIVEPATVVRDLGVLLDSELSLKKHISKVASVCYFHLRRQKPIRQILGRHKTTSLINAFVLSRLDYSNSVLAGLPKSTTYNSIAERSQCCRGTDLWSRSAWSRDAGFIRAALASCRTTGDI